MHDARSERHCLFLREVAVIDFCFKGAPYFVSRLNCVSHRAGGPTRVTAEGEQLV